MELSNYNLIAIDTNIFIYHLTKNTRFHLQARKLFETTIKNKVNIVTSNVTLIELLSPDIPLDWIEVLKEKFMQTPYLKIIEVSNDIALEAAEIRRKYKFTLPDAIHLATAQLFGAEVFITNDQKLKKFKKIKVLQLPDLSF